jgi:FMN phosphatase YigB (HAD superfamily)
MAQIKHIFLDDGGVMNDNSLRSPQWQRLIGEYFIPRFGGTPEAWANANRKTFEEAWLLMLRRIENWDGSRSYLEVQRQYELDWLERMFNEMEIELPPDPNVRLALAMEANAYIMPRVHAEYPGAVDAVGDLAHDYVVFTSSGGTSVELGYTLQGMGIRDCFQPLYGPDLVNMPKIDSRYYQRILQDAGVDPTTSLVLDDKVEILQAAAVAGARVVQVTSQRGSEGIPAIRALSDLPALLRSRLLE